MYFSWEYSSVDKLAVIYHEKYSLAKLKQCEVPILYYFNESLKLLRKKQNAFKASRLKSVEVDRLNWRKQVSQQKAIRQHTFPQTSWFEKPVFCLKNVFDKYRELNQGHILNSNEYEPGPLTDQFSNLYLCSVAPNLHAVLLISRDLWYKATLSTQMSIEELGPNLFCNAVNIERNT